MVRRAIAVFLALALCMTLVPGIARADECCCPRYLAVT